MLPSSPVFLSFLILSLLAMRLPWLVLSVLNRCRLATRLLPGWDLPLAAPESRLAGPWKAAEPGTFLSRQEVDMYEAWVDRHVSGGTWNHVRAYFQRRPGGREHAEGGTAVDRL
jgi:hypothetical protein